MMNFQQIILVCVLSSAGAFQSNPTAWKTASTTTMLHSSSNDNSNNNINDRRSFVDSLVAGAAALTLATVAPQPANAGIDPSLLRSYSVEGDDAGTAQRLRQIEDIQRPASDNLNIPYEKLASGVEYREYREGKGDAGA